MSSYMWWKQGHETGPSVVLGRSKLNLKSSSPLEITKIFYFVWNMCVYFKKIKISSEISSFIPSRILFMSLPESKQSLGIECPVCSVTRTEWKGKYVRERLTSFSWVTAHIFRHISSVTVSVLPRVPIVCYADIRAPVVIRSDTTPCPERDWAEDFKLEMCSGCWTAQCVLAATHGAVIAAAFCRVAAGFEFMWRGVLV